MADSRSQELAATIILFLALTWTTFPLRIWVRAKILKTLGVDDILTAFTMILYSVFGAWVLFAVHHGAGKHNHDVQPKNIIQAMKGWHIAETFYILSCFFLKVAFGLFLLRVATEKSHRRLIWGLITVNVLFYLFYVFQSVFQCWPVEHYWLRVDPRHKGSCHDPSFVANSTYAQSGLSIVTDFAYALLPILIVRKLQMSRYKRISLSVMLGLGTVASIAVIVRIPYVVHLASTEDFLWQTTDVAIWSCVEPGLGLTILNLVVTRPLFRSIFARFGDVTSAAISKNRGYSSKMSAFGKSSAYGASTTMASAHGNTTCSNSACICTCHQPCICGNSGTFLEDRTPSEVEHGFALGTITSPKSAHLSPGQKGIRMTTDISTSSIPKSEYERRNSEVVEITKSLSGKDDASIFEYEDKQMLVKPLKGRRESYRHSLTGRAL